MVILTCSVLQDNTGVYQMRDCVRDHEEKTLGEVMKEVWGLDWETQEGEAEDQHKDYEKLVAKDEDGKLYCKGIPIAEFLKQQAQRNGNPTRKRHIALAVFVAPKGGYNNVGGTKYYHPSEHFMCVFWLSIQGRVQFFYNDAIKSKKSDRVKLLRPGHPCLNKSCYAQCIVDMWSKFVEGYSRNYDAEVTAVRKWLAQLTWNGANSCAFDVAILALLSTFHAGILCKTGVIAIPGNSGDKPRQEVTSAQNFLIQLHSHRELTLDLNAARTFFIAWMEQYHIDSCATLGADGKNVVPARRFQVGKMVDCRIPLQSLLESAAGSKLQLLVAIGSTAQEMRQVGSESLAWLKAPTQVCHLRY